MLAKGENSMLNPSPILHLKAAALRDRITQLRSELAAVIEARTELELWEGPALEALYLTKIGPLELRKLKIQAETSQSQRRLELLQRELNRGITITRKVLIAIDQELETEMAAWQARLLEREQAIRTGQAQVDAPLLNLQEIKCLKAHYRHLCRLLHPDLTGGETALFKCYWHEVQRAYRRADVELLESLLTAIKAGQEDMVQFILDSLTALQEECERLRALIARQTERLCELRTVPPYCYAMQLKDERWMTAKIAALEAEIAHEDQIQQHMLLTLESMLDSLCATKH
jgi:hypothetical protein